jgi:hypothetical protein
MLEYQRPESRIVESKEFNDNDEQEQDNDEIERIRKQHEKSIDISLQNSLKTIDFYFTL